MAGLRPAQSDEANDEAANPSKKTKYNKKWLPCGECQRCWYRFFLGLRFRVVVAKGVTFRVAGMGRG